MKDFKWDSFGRYFGLENLASIREHVEDERIVRVVDSLYVRRGSREFNWATVQNGLRACSKERSFPLAQELQPHDNFHEREGTLFM